MPQYCNSNDYKAEIIFELISGGKEGRILSFDPPILIERVSGYYGEIVASRFFEGSFESGTGIKVIENVVGTMFVKKQYSGVSWLYPMPGERYHHRYEVEYKQPPNSAVLYCYKVFELDNETGIENLIYTSPWAQFNTGSDFFKILRYVSDVLIIQDTNGILWTGEAKGYQVECFGCSDNEVPISAGEEDFICVNKQKVIGELGSIRAKTISIIDYLNL